jgi:uncharacterized protein YjbJ (UPF0337 family)
MKLGKHLSTHGEPLMNKNQLKGAAKDIAGKVQQNAGKLVGNKEQEAKGLVKQVQGKARRNLGDAQEVMKDATKKH